MSRVIVIGSINYDNFLSVENLPLVGQTIYASSVVSACGGKGANQAVQCSKLGIQTMMVGAVGTDTAAVKLLESLRLYNVDTSLVRTVEGSSGQAYVTNAKNGELLSVIIEGSNAKVSKSDVDAAEKFMDNDTCVVLQMEIPVKVIEYAIERARLKGTKIFFNAAPSLPISEKYFSMVDYAIFNETEAEYYLGHTLESLEDAKNAVSELHKKFQCGCIITLGKSGAVAIKETDVVFCPPLDVKVVETTGAGDSFIGGFIYATSQGMDIKAGMEFATKCSSSTIQKIGAQDAMPYLKEIIGE